MRVESSDGIVVTLNPQHSTLNPPRQSVAAKVAGRGQQDEAKKEHGEKVNWEARGVRSPLTSLVQPFEPSSTEYARWCKKRMIDMLTLNTQHSTLNLPRAFSVVNLSPQPAVGRSR